MRRPCRRPPRFAGSAGVARARRPGRSSSLRCETDQAGRGPGSMKSSMTTLATHDRSSASNSSRTASAKALAATAGGAAPGWAPRADRTNVDTSDWQYSARRSAFSGARGGCSPGRSSANTARPGRDAGGRGPVTCRRRPDEPPHRGQRGIELMGEEAHRLAQRHRGLVQGTLEGLDRYSASAARAGPRAWLARPVASPGCAAPGPGSPRSPFPSRHKVSASKRIRCRCSRRTVFSSFIVISGIR